MVVLFLAFPVSSSFALMFAHLRGSHLFLPFQTDSGREYFHLKVSVRSLAGWNSAALMLGKAQWHSLQAAPSAAEVSFGKDCRGSSVAQTTEVLPVAVESTAVGVLNDRGCWGLFCLWEEF